MSNRRVVAIDTESVGIGPANRDQVAQVSLVEMNTNREYNAYISRQNITDYRTKYSGITPQILASNGRPFDVVKKEVLNFIQGAILVGHSIHYDLTGLGIVMMNQDDIRDISKYRDFTRANKGRTPSLAFLAKRFLNKKIRQNGQHSCMEDAHTSLELYKLIANKWEAELNSKRHRSYVGYNDYDERFDYGFDPLFDDSYRDYDIDDFWNM